MAKIAKEVNPKWSTLIGGPHVSFWDENALNEYPQFDIIVRKKRKHLCRVNAENLRAGKPYFDVVVQHPKRRRNSQKSRSAIHQDS